MGDSYSIRCPMCLNVTSVPKDIDLGATLTCINCLRRYEFRNALADRSTPQESSEAAAPRGNLLVSLGVPLAIVLVAAASWVAVPLDGMNFLGLYALFGFAMFVMATLVRWYYLDSFAASTLAALAYVAVGLIRFVEGSSRGLENFEYMWTMLAVGFFLFFIRYEQKDGRDTMTFFGNCGGCGSSSCGGGSCGGGCGGCG